MYIMGKKGDLADVKVSEFAVLLQEGQSVREIALKCGISVGCVPNIKRRLMSGTTKSVISGNFKCIKKTSQKTQTTTPEKATIGIGFAAK